MPLPTVCCCDSIEVNDADRNAAFLVELFPFAQRTKGITIFQFFSRPVVFTTSILNLMGLKHVQGRWLICELRMASIWSYLHRMPSPCHVLTAVVFPSYHLVC
jgi:hypothetical protein